MPDLELGLAQLALRAREIPSVVVELLLDSRGATGPLSRLSRLTLRPLDLQKSCFPRVDLEHRRALGGLELPREPPSAQGDGLRALQRLAPGAVRTEPLGGEASGRLAAGTLGSELAP